MNDKTTAKDVDLDDLVASVDTGGRQPEGLSLKILLGVALLWSLFQLWIAAPLQFYLDFFILNNTESRSIHLAFAVFLAFLAYPFSARSPRHRIPLIDWGLALVGAFCSAYLYLFYEDLSTRPGLPTTMDTIAACVGMLILLEATRRALGPPLMVVAAIFLFYTFAGSWEYMPEIISHKGASLNKVTSHQWLTTEGVYGVALGVSTGFVFLFVLFGALLDKAGAGNYFIKLAFALLGHLRGGPAKAAVLSSAMTGLISGSSIANVVTTGTFTIPLMRRVGFTREKAGAVEVASSVNGQIMPPVMGAAAFLMVEYVGIPYIDVIRHAFLPAIISYIALLYMVHLEALKQDMPVLPKSHTRKLYQTLLLTGIIAASFAILAGIAYYLILGIKAVAGDLTGGALAVLIGAVYIGLLAIRARYPDLEEDDPNAPVFHLPQAGETFRTGLHFLLPIVVLVWCLMIERMSPGLSAFWATVLMMVILITQRPIVAWMRKQGDRISDEMRAGGYDLLDGLITGARNMIGIGVATAAAGIVVGTVSLTGIGQVMTELVELLSGGSIMMVLILTAVISLILGMGLPTTANYIVVSSLMAPVVVELAGQSGLVVPLIAVHMFVFYFGIMADVTPPVGLASFAAAAVSGGDPIRTGLQAFLYSSRTVILPFLFIFNTDLLLIDVDSIGHGVFIFVIATVAILVFSAAMQGYFFARSRRYESALLLLVAFTLFRPGYWVDTFFDPYSEIPATELVAQADTLKARDNLRLHVEGEDELGDPTSFIAVLPLGEGTTGEERLNNAGLFIRMEGNKAIVDDLGFNSEAEKAGLDFDFAITTVETPQPQPDKRLFYIPAFLVLALVIGLQWGRRKQSPKAQKKQHSGSAALSATTVSAEA